VDDFDDLLSGSDAAQNILADAFQLHAFDELARDFEMHVGGEEGGTHFGERLRHVFLGKFSDSAQIAQCVAEFFGERFEHANLTVGAVSGGWQLEVRRKQEEGQ
jgi:hypothetical protein